MLDKTPVKHVILAAMGDMLGFTKGSLVNYVVRKKKKLVPPFAGRRVKFNDAIARGKPAGVVTVEGEV